MMESALKTSSSISSSTSLVNSKDSEIFLSPFGASLQEHRPSPLAVPGLSPGHENTGKVRINEPVQQSSAPTVRRFCVSHYDSVKSYLDKLVPDCHHVPLFLRTSSIPSLHASVHRTPTSGQKAMSPRNYSDVLSPRVSSSLEDNNNTTTYRSTDLKPMNATCAAHTHMSHPYGNGSQGYSNIASVAIRSQQGSGKRLKLRVITRYTLFQLNSRTGK